MSLQRMGAMRVRHVLIGVVCAINLDNHARANATEVHDVAVQDVLPTEVLPGESMIA